MKYVVVQIEISWLVEVSTNRTAVVIGAIDYKECITGQIS